MLSVSPAASWFRRLACAGCVDGLVKLGARVVTGPREGTLLDRCATHRTDAKHVHASTLVELTESHLDAWRVELEPLAPRVALSAEGAELVAGYAVALLAGGPNVEATEAEIERAVEMGRNILERSLALAAKGDGT